MEENPEAFAQVYMLYVPLEVNGHPLKAFVDSGVSVPVSVSASVSVSAGMTMCVCMRCEKWFAQNRVDCFCSTNC